MKLNFQNFYQAIIYPFSTSPENFRLISGQNRSNRALKVRVFWRQISFWQRKCREWHKNAQQEQWSAAIFSVTPAFSVPKSDLPSKHPNFERPVWTILITYRSEIFRRCRKKADDCLVKVSQILLQFSLWPQCHLQKCQNFHFSNKRHLSPGWAWISILCSNESSSDKLSNGENRMSLSALDKKL